MKDLKTTMHDESLMFAYKDFGTSSCMIKKFTTNTKLLDDHIVRRGYLSPPFQIIPPAFKKILNPPLPNIILPNPESSYADCFN